MPCMLLAFGYLVRHLQRYEGKSIEMGFLGSDRCDGNRRSGFDELF